MEFEDLASFSLHSSEKFILGDLLLKKIKTAILSSQATADLFTICPGGSQSDAINFSLNQEQFKTFLDRYLKLCEDADLFEQCLEITKLLDKLKSELYEKGGNKNL